MKTYTVSLTFLAIAVLLLAGVLLFKPINQAFGSAFTGTSAQLRVSTTTAVGPQAVPAKTVFALNGACKSRIISTQGVSAIMISFGEPTTPGNISSSTLSGQVGILQPASTTVTYDSGLYGCGTVTAWAFTSSTITTSEF